jgi:hypothetical protein
MTAGRCRGLQWLVCCRSFPPSLLSSPVSTGAIGGGTSTRTPTTWNWRATKAARVLEPLLGLDLFLPRTLWRPAKYRQGHRLLQHPRIPAYTYVHRRITAPRSRTLSDALLTWRARTDHPTSFLALYRRPRLQRTRPSPSRSPASTPPRRPLRSTTTSARRPDTDRTPMADHAIGRCRIRQHPARAPTRHLANTVRKHLENIYERLNASSRTHALARAFPGRALIADTPSAPPGIVPRLDSKYQTSAQHMKLLSSR